MDKKIKFLNKPPRHPEVSRILNRFRLRSIFKAIIKTLGLNKNIYYYIFEADDKSMEYINYTLLHKTGPTNVISHAVYNNLQIIKNLSRSKKLFLGHLYFNSKYIIKQSEEFKINLYYHFTHLMVHSILHLLGFDHQIYAQKTIMENMENKILYKLIKYQPWQLDEIREEKSCEKG